MPIEDKKYTNQDMINANRVAVLESRVNGIDKNYVTGTMLHSTIAQSEARTNTRVDNVAKQVNKATWIISGFVACGLFMGWLDKNFAVFTIGT